MKNCSQDSLRRFHEQQKWMSSETRAVAEASFLDSAEAIANHEIQGVKTQDVQLGTFRIKDGLFVGDAKAAINSEFLLANKISHIINCSPLQVPNYFEKCGIRYLPIEVPLLQQWDPSCSRNVDPLWQREATSSEATQGNEFDVVKTDGKLIEYICHFIEDGLKEGGSCLIHSNNDQLRPCVLLAVYFMKKFSWSANKCLEFLASRRPDLFISEAQRIELWNLEIEITKMLDGVRSVSETWNVVNSASLDDEELLLRNTYINSLPTDFLDSDDYLWTRCECSFDNVAINFFDKVDSASPKGHSRTQKKNRRSHNPRSCEVPRIMAGPSVKWKDEGEHRKNIHQNVSSDAKDAKESLPSSSKPLSRTLKAIASGCETDGLEVGELALADLKTHHLSCSPENVIQLQRSIEKQLQYLEDVDQSASTIDSSCLPEFISHTHRRQHSGSNTPSVDKKPHTSTSQARNGSSSGDSNSPVASDSRHKVGKHLIVADVGTAIIADDCPVGEGVEREIGKAEVQNSRLAGSVPIGKKKLQSPVDASKPSVYSSEGGVDVVAAKVNAVSGVEEKVGCFDRRHIPENLVVNGGAKKEIYAGEKYLSKVLAAAPEISVTASDSCNNCSSCENKMVGMIGIDRLYEHGGCEKTEQIKCEVQACRPISSSDGLKTNGHNSKEKSSSHYVKRRRRDPSKKTRGQCESGNEEVFEGNYLVDNRIQNSENDHCHFPHMASYSTDSFPIGRLGAAKGNQNRNEKMPVAKKRHSSLNAPHVSSPCRSSQRTNNKQRHLKHQRKQAVAGGELCRSWHEFAESGGATPEFTGIYDNDTGHSGNYANNYENTNIPVSQNVDSRQCGGSTATVNGSEALVSVVGTKPTVANRHTSPTKKSSAPPTSQAAGLVGNSSPRNTGSKNASPVARSSATSYVMNHTNVPNCGPIPLKPPNVPQKRVSGLTRDRPDTYLSQGDSPQGHPKVRQPKTLPQSDTSFSRFNNNFSNSDKTCNDVENTAPDLSHSYSASFLSTAGSRPYSLEMKAAVNHVVTTLSMADECDVDEGCGALKPHVANSPSLLYSRGNVNVSRKTEFSLQYPRATHTQHLDVSSSLSFARCQSEPQFVNIFRAPQLYVSAALPNNTPRNRDGAYGLVRRLVDV